MYYLFLLLFVMVISMVERAAAVKCTTLEPVCPNENVTYWLYNKELSKKPYQIIADDTVSILKAPFVQHTELVVLVHGYTGHRDYSPNPELRSAYLNRGKVNVISLDYGEAAKEGCYIHAAYNAEVVGRCAALLINQIFRLRSDVASPATTHVVGFSLGSHVSGAIGRYLAEEGMNLSRVTGLDPALPLFEPMLTSQRLKVGDALFVDVIHTNAGFKGKILQVGDVDFYINNARIQPGCISNSSCDHVRAVEVYAESIGTTEGFYGIPCIVNYVFSVIAGISENACTIEHSLIGKKPVLMGEYISHQARGTYLVVTNDQPPYAKGVPSMGRGQEYSQYFIDSYKNSSQI